LAGLLVHELAAVLFLDLVGVQNDLGALGGLEGPASDLEVLKNDKSLRSTGIEGLEGVLDTVATLPVSREISSKYLLMSFFSWMNLTFPSVSLESSMAWLKPFSPP